MSELDYSFHPIPNLDELLALPLTDFVDFDVRFHPTVTEDVFRKNLFRLLAHGRPMSVNGKSPNLIASIFNAAGASHLFDGFDQWINSTTEETAEIYRELLSSEFYEKEYILRHAADMKKYDPANIVERNIVINIFTNVGVDGMGRKYAISWVNKPGDGLKPAIVINFEQTSVRRLNIQSPPGANRDITRLISTARQYRPEDTPESKPQTLAVSSFYWNSKSEPSFLRTIMGNGEDNNLDLQFHQSYIPSELSFPIIHAIGKEWQPKKFTINRIHLLLLNFVKSVPNVSDYCSGFKIGRHGPDSGRLVFSNITDKFDEAEATNLFMPFVRRMLAMGSINELSLTVENDHYVLDVKSEFTDRPFMVSIPDAE